MIRSLRPVHRTLLAAGVATAALAVVILGAGALQPTDAGANNSAGGEVTSPAEYSEAAFLAWLDGDSATLIEHTAPPAAQVLLARSPGDDAWSGPPICEGAAGSTYCTWTSGDSQLLLRVGNEAASLGEPHAIYEAAFIPAAHGVAIGPFTTQDAANTTQASVDEGHSPWMTDSIAVATFFARSELGWDAPIVEPTVDPARFRIFDSTTGVALDVTATQPVRTGPDDTWAITRLGPSVGQGTPPGDVDHR